MELVSYFHKRMPISSTPFNAKVLGPKCSHLGVPMMSTPYLLVQKRNTARVPAAFKRRFQPDSNNFQGQRQRKEALAEGNHVGVVVQTGQARRFEVPAQGTPHAADAIGRHRLAVS